MNLPLLRLDMSVLFRSLSKKGFENDSDCRLGTCCSLIDELEKGFVREVEMLMRWASSTWMQEKPADLCGCDSERCAHYLQSFSKGTF